MENVYKHFIRRGGLVSVYAISDLHLAFFTKPMDIFGEHWGSCSQDKGKPTRVIRSDLVVLPGDISWAMTLDEFFRHYVHRGIVDINNIKRQSRRGGRQLKN